MSIEQNKEVTLTELILCLPDDSKKKVLELVQDAEDSLMGDESLEIESQYYAIKENIKKYITD